MDFLQAELSAAGRVDEVVPGEFWEATAVALRGHAPNERRRATPIPFHS